MLRGRVRQTSFWEAGGPERPHAKRRLWSDPTLRKMLDALQHYLQNSRLASLVGRCWGGGPAGLYFESSAARDSQMLTSCRKTPCKLFFCLYHYLQSFRRAPLGVKCLVWRTLTPPAKFRFASMLASSRSCRGRCGVDRRPLEFFLLPVTLPRVRFFVLMGSCVRFAH